MTKINKQTARIIRQHIALGNMEAAQRMAESTLRTIEGQKKRQEFLKAINAEVVA